MRPASAPWMILSVTLAVGHTLPRNAVAGLPEMEDALVGRADAEWFDQCPDGSTTGVACQGSVCGVDFVLDPAAAQRFITIDGNAWDLHSGSGDDFAVAGLLNAVCNDTAAIFTSPLGMQNLLGLDVARQSLSRSLPNMGERAGLGRGLGTVTTDPGPLLGVGGGLELGSSGYYSAMVPVSYAHSFSRDMFGNINGALSHSILPEGGFTKLNAVPSFGVLGGNEKLSWGAGGYAPLDLSYTSISLIDYSLTAFDVGVGGVGVVSALVGRAQIAGGAVADFRYSSAAGTQLPMSALVRAVHPVSIVDGFASLLVGSNPIHAGTTTMVARVGAEYGEWEFGYQLAIGTGNVSHMLGVMHRQRLRRTEVLERPTNDGTQPAPKAPSDAAEPQQTPEQAQPNGEKPPEPAPGATEPQQTPEQAQPNGEEPPELAPGATEPPPEALGDDDEPQQAPEQAQPNGEKPPEPPPGDDDQPQPVVPGAPPPP